MNSAAKLSRWLSACALLGWWLTGAAASGATATLYETRFEYAEGFRTNLALGGQNGWTMAGSGGNGIVTNYILGLGQQGYVGYYPPNVGDRLLSVWKPVNFAPSNAALVRFSVEMSVIDSTTTDRDEFYWTVYNTAGQRLFGVRFDNYDLSIHHELDNGTNYPTGWFFENSTSYTLGITMSFASNRWNAFLNGTHIVTNQPITTQGAARTLGDVDAEWYLGVPNQPGNNYLLFDNYKITADPLPAVIPTVQAPVAAGGGSQLVRVNGKDNAQYAIEASTNLVSWSALKTNVVTGGYFDHLDTGAAELRQRFYRARWVP